MDYLKETLPADLFDPVTLWSLGSTVAILVVAYVLSLWTLDSTVSKARRFLFIWHAFDALIHFCLEGSFLYHCFFSWVPSSDAAAGLMYPSAYNYLGHEDARVYGAQAGGSNPLAQLWMVYARADRRWAGADLVRIENRHHFFLPLRRLFFCFPLVSYSLFYPLLGQISS